MSFLLYIKKTLKPLKGSFLDNRFTRKIWRIIYEEGYHLTTPKFVKINRTKMIVPPTHSYLLTNRIIEPIQTAVFKSRLKKKMRVVDIGANIGYYTLLAARLVGRKGQVFAFEPTPYTIRILRENIKLNKLRNILLSDKAVSDRSGKRKFFMGPKACASNSFSKERFQEGFKEISEQTVETVSLDDFLKKLKSQK